LDKVGDRYVVTPHEKALQKVMQALRELPTSSRESTEQTFTEAFGPWDQLYCCDRNALRGGDEVFGNVASLTSKGRPQMFAPGPLFDDTFVVEQDENVLANFSIEPPERVSTQVRDTAISHMPPKSLSERCSDHGNDETKLQDIHCMAVDQFSDSMFDNTPTAVAIFHQCRRNGFL
jgi:hypothetical protein